MEELAALLGLMRLAGVAAQLGQAVALFAGGWACAQLLGHAGLPLLRLGYAEDGGELGRLGLAAAVLVGATLAGAGATAYALRPPVVHLAAGVHQGPIVITRREVLVGEPGAVVRGGIVVRADGGTIVGGQEGITTHSSMAEIMNNRISRTTMEGISVSEMSMTTVKDNEVRDARGVGIYCNDRSICAIERNTVVGTAGTGFGVLAS